VKSVTIKSVSDYLAACDQLSALGKMLFRGQTNDYPEVLPTLFRKNAMKVSPALPELATRFYVECYGIGSWDLIEVKRRQRLEESYDPIGGLFSPQPPMNWEEFGDWISGDNLPMGGPGPGPNYTRDDFIGVLKARFEEDESLRPFQDAFLQHYGLPTRALDVSFDPVVALWFATHKHHTAQDGSQDYALLQEETSVVYVFALAGAEVLDLRKVNCHPWDPEQERIPYFGLRGVQQEGGLYFGATKEDPDLRHHVICQFHLSPALWDAEALGGRFYATEKLFPPPEQDFFYRALLDQSSRPGSDYYPLGAFIARY
jgi:hypothetical protein